MLDLSRNKLKSYSLFLLFLLILPVIYAPQPIFESASVTIEGLVIETPIFEFIPSGRNHTFHAHVVNESTGIQMIDDTTDCFFDLYNNDGTHQMQNVEMSFEAPREFEIMVGADNFTVGFHSLLIQCNATSGGSRLGGFLEETFIVTDEIHTENRDKQRIIYYVIILAIILFVIGLWKQDPNLISFAGIMMIVTGVYILINGFFTGTEDLITRTVGVIILCLGGYIFIRSQMENAMSNLDNDGEE